MQDASSDDPGACHIDQDHIHNPDDPFTFALYRIVWGVSGGVTIATIIISVVLIIFHLRNYTRPEQQRYIIRILLMVPIYAANSWFSLRFYWLSAYFDVLRDCYEAYVIFSFFYLLTEYIGGYERCKDILETLESFRPIPPLCCFHILPRRAFLRASMRLTLQYVFVRPAVTFATLILSIFGLYCGGTFRADRGHVYLVVATSLSTTLAMFALVQFYVIFKDYMQDYSPGKKFIAVKFVVFLSFWQSIGLALLQDSGVLKPIPHWSLHDVHDGLQNLLIVFEMLGAAIFHVYVFPYKDYAVRNIRLSVWHSILDVINPSDVVLYSKRSFVIRKRKVTMTDVLQKSEDETESPLMQGDPEEGLEPLMNHNEEEDDEDNTKNNNNATVVPRGDMGFAEYKKLRATV